jgi:hypothetical protein
LPGDGYRLAQGLKVSGGGAGIVSHAGVALIRALADNSGLIAGLSKALADVRPRVHDRAGCWPTWPARSLTAAIMKMPR